MMINAIKKYLLLIILMLCLSGCSQDEDTIQFHDKVINKADLSEETIEWLERYNLLSEEEQLATSSVPKDLYELCDFYNAEDEVAVEDIEILDFSYEEEIANYKENEPGVFYEGFQNVTSVEMTMPEDVIERAKKECTVPYDTTKVYYDKEQDIWKVLFYAATDVGGGQTVYMDEQGITTLIVYGE